MTTPPLVPRKHVFGFVLLLLASSVACNTVRWRANLRGAFREAAEDGRMVVVWYWQPLNNDCRTMDRTVFRTEEVLKQMQTTVPVRLHADFSKKWAAENGIAQVPSFIAYTPEGKFLRRREGIMDADQFLAFLAVARLSP